MSVSSLPSWVGGTSFLWPLEGSCAVRARWGKNTDAEYTDKHNRRGEVTVATATAIPDYLRELNQVREE